MRDYIMTDRFVAILMGSDSDLPQMQGAIDILKKFSIRTEVKVTSAHRTPKQLIIMLLMPRGGCAVYIAGAGMAAHLARAVAANTTRPVIRTY